MFFAYLIAPLVELVSRPITLAGHRLLIPRALAIGIVYLVLFASIGIAGYVLLPRLGTQVTEFGRQVPTYMAHARDQLYAWRYFINPDHFPQAVREAVEKTLARTTSLGDYRVRLRGLLRYWASSLVPSVPFWLLSLKGCRVFRPSILRLSRGRLRVRAPSCSRTLITPSRLLLAGVAACYSSCCCTSGFMASACRMLFSAWLACRSADSSLVGPPSWPLHKSGRTLSSIARPRRALFLGTLRIAQAYVIFPRLVRRGIPGSAG